MIPVQRTLLCLDFCGWQLGCVSSSLFNERYKLLRTSPARNQYCSQGGTHNDSPFSSCSVFEACDGHSICLKNDTKTDDNIIDCDNAIGGSDTRFRGSPGTGSGSSSTTMQPTVLGPNDLNSVSLNHIVMASIPLALAQAAELYPRSSAVTSAI